MVGVLPCRTDTRWFDDVLKGSELRLIKGRLHYGDGRDAAPFPSCVCVWRKHDGPLPVIKRIDIENNPVDLVPSASEQKRIGDF